MADVQFSLKKKKSAKPPFMVIYGGSGTGKTQLAISAPEAVFLQTEDGAGEREINTLKDGVFDNYDEILEALRWIYKNPEGISTVVIDSIDHLEPIIWAKVCKDNEWDSIESPGYGRGYIECDKLWQQLIKALLLLRDAKGMQIICIAHEQIRTVNDPTASTPYDAHELKLHKRAVALFKENADMIGLLKPLVTVDKKTRKARGGNSPALFVRPNAAYTAKTRYPDMPNSIMIPEENGWDEIAGYIPFYNDGVTKDAENTNPDENSD